MKNIIAKLNKLFDSRIRLGIMAMLMVNEWVEYNAFKETLELTDGNLASHLKTLEKNKIIEIKKQFISRKPKTSYKATELGIQLFKQHLDGLEKLLQT